MKTRLRLLVTAPDADAEPVIERQDLAPAHELSSQDEAAIVEALAQALAAEYRRRHGQGTSVG